MSTDIPEHNHENNNEERFNRTVESFLHMIDEMDCEDCRDAYSLDLSEMITNYSQFILGEPARSITKRIEDIEFVKKMWGASDGEVTTSEAN